MARKPEGDLKHARASALAQTPFKSDEGGTSEAAERRAKAHFWREDPIAGRRLVKCFAVGSSKRAFTPRVHQANNKHMR